MHEVAVMAMASALAATMDDRDGRLPDRTGNRHPGLAIAPYNVYQASDGYVALFCVTERHWRAATEVMGHPELADDPQFCSNFDRAQHMDDVDSIIQGWILGKSRGEVVALLSERRVPCAPVLRVDEVIRDEHLRERGAWIDVEDRGRSIRLPTSPLRLHGTPLRGIDQVAPSLGEHTESVLKEFCRTRRMETGLE